MTHGTLSLRGARLAYSDEGDGPTVVSAHGLLQSREADRSPGLIDWAALPAAGFRLISYDARGHGDSSGTIDPDSYGWDALSDDLLALVDAVSPADPVRAFGVSMGTGTLLHALTKAPSRFTAVTLGAPPTAWETRSAQGSMYDGLAALVESKPSGDLADLFAAAPLAPIFQGVAGFPSAPTPPRELLPSILRGAGHTDLPDPELLRAVDVPALILAWATDPGHPISTAERLKELLPASTLHVSATAPDIKTWAARAAAFFG